MATEVVDMASEIIVANEACKRSILFYEERFFIYVPTTVFKLSVLRARYNNNIILNYFKMAFSLKAPKDLENDSKLFLPYLPNIWNGELGICLGEEHNLQKKSYPETVEQMEEVIKFAIDYFWNSEFNGGAGHFGALRAYSNPPTLPDYDFISRLHRKTKTGWTPSEKDLKPKGNFSDFMLLR